MNQQQYSMEDLTAYLNKMGISNIGKALTPQDIFELSFKGTLCYNKVLELVKDQLPYKQIGRKYFIWPIDYAKWMLNQEINN